MPSRALSSESDSGIPLGQHCFARTSVIAIRWKRVLSLDPMEASPFVPRAEQLTPPAHYLNRPRRPKLETSA
jgi:hypothetical protein